MLLIEPAELFISFATKNLRNLKKFFGGLSTAVLHTDHAVLRKKGNA